MSDNPNPLLMPPAETCGEKHVSASGRRATCTGPRVHTAGAHYWQWDAEQPDLDPTPSTAAVVSRDFIYAVLDCVYFSAETDGEKFSIECNYCDGPGSLFSSAVDWVDFAVEHVASRHADRLPQPVAPAPETSAPATPASAPGSPL